MRPARVVVACWPDWPAVAAGCRPDRPAAVVSANRVVALTPAARAEGVETGLRRREAQGRCPDLEVLAAEPGRDARAWEPVVAAVEELTPKVEVLAPGALCFPARAASRYFGGDTALAVQVRQVVTAAGGGCGPDGRLRWTGGQVGVADGRFAAGLAAEAAGRTARDIAAPPPDGMTDPPSGDYQLRAGVTNMPSGDNRLLAGVLVVPSGATRAWLSPQPIQVLGPAMAELSDLLVRLGIRTLGDLAALPAAAVLGRFGLVGQTAHRLALGLDERAMQGRDIPPDLSCSAEMDPPEQRVEAAAFVAKTLADQLHARLREAGLVTMMVAIEVETEHGETFVRHWRHEGELSAQALAERTRWQLDGWLSGTAARAPTGGLIRLCLRPLEVRPHGGRQLDLWGGTTDVDARAARAIARVQGLLGPESVVAAVLVGARDHADQVRLVPWGDVRDHADQVRLIPWGESRAQASRRPRGRREDPTLVPPWPGRLPPPSPPLVHRPALTAYVCDARGCLVEVSGRGCLSATPAGLAVGGGPVTSITAWAGPWPVEERWWDGSGRRRARFQMVVETGQAHLVCREGGRWWVEASYG